MLANNVVIAGNESLKDGAKLTDKSPCAYYGMILMANVPGVGDRITMRSAVYGNGNEPYENQDYAVFAVVELLDSVKFVGRRRKWKVEFC